MCWITASRPPWAVRNVYLTPTPGSRVSRRSTGNSCLLGQSRGGGWEQGAAQALRLLHEHEADGRGREHVEAREGDELLLLAARDGRVIRGDLRKDDRELAVRDERRARVQALASRETPDRAGDGR